MKTIQRNKIKFKVFTEEELKEKLGMGQEDIQVVLEYQDKFPELLQEKEGFCIDARSLHKQLKIGTEFAKWIKRRIDKYNFIENEDFIVVWNDTQNNIIEFNGNIHNMVRNGYRCSYIITIDMAIFLCEKEKFSPKNYKLIQFLYEVKEDNVKLIPKGEKRLEYQFGDMLEKITGLNWKKQYPIDGGKYRLDFYLPNVLIVEYDEEHHSNQLEQDEERMNYCRYWLANYNTDGTIRYDDGWRCPVIRVKKGEELEGLNRIIRHLAGFKCFDTQYNYNLQVCDIKNY